jgi:hypothetical protein
MIMGFSFAAVSVGLPMGQSYQSPERSSEVSQFSIQIDCIMLTREIITVYFEHHTTPISVLCGQNAELLNVTAGGTYSYNCTFEWIINDTHQLVSSWHSNQNYLTLQWLRKNGKAHTVFI